jgi:hypothetical protein
MNATITATVGGVSDADEGGPIAGVIVFFRGCA